MQPLIRRFPNGETLPLQFWLPFIFLQEYAIVHLVWNVSIINGARNWGGDSPLKRWRKLTSGSETSQYREEQKTTPT